MTTKLKRMIVALLACSATLLMPDSHAADIDSSRYSAKVKVNVSASDNIKSSMSSYINRELRSLTDVEIVEKDPEWTINIMAMDLTTRGSGIKSGVAISTVILGSFDPQILSVWLQPQFKEDILDMTSGLAWYLGHWMNVGSPSDLQDLCKDIVAEFDAKYLEQSRRSYRQFKERRKTLK